MKEKKEFAIRMIILIIEFASNVISLIIIPMPHKFRKDYLMELVYHDINIDYSYIESKLSSPRKTAVAILVFGCFLGLVHIFKIILYICNRNSLNDLNEISYCVDAFNILFLFINWCMSISIIPKLNKIRGDGYNNKLTDDIKARIIGIICLYSLCYIYIILQYNVEHMVEKCTKEEKPKNTVEGNPRSIIALRIRNDDNNINTTSRNNITTNMENNNITTTNRIVLLSNILPEQIYRNIRTFIELGKAKLLILAGFFIEMKFDGLTDRDSIIKEISELVIIVGKILGDVFNDKIAKALLESGSEDSLMLLLHYIFPFVVAVIKSKIEKGIYKKSADLSQANFVQVLTQIERKIELDEQGNIKLSFRISKQVSQVPLERLLSP
jgi:hypothetical protein